MAEGRVKQVIEKEITCALCLDLFKRPKKLPCDHVYCRDCLRGLALRSLNATISCPECRTLCQVPGNDINNFPTAFQTNRLIEAFQQVQVQVETDSPNVAEMCQAHPTQQLAMYCETCKKQLCRDCVLMTKKHASHEYGFFEEVAPKYRKKVANELSLIKTQNLSISSALGEIVATESSVAAHAQKCQDDVEHAFEKLISVIQTCKQAMKDKATAYYSSLTGVFDQQKENLKEIQSKIEPVISSVDTTLQDDDQGFLARLEATFERISSLQKNFQAVSLVVPKPQLIVMQSDHDIDVLEQYMKKSFFFKAHNLADAQICIDDSSYTDAKLCVGQQIVFTLILHDSSRNISIGKNEIDVHLIKGDHSIKGKLEPSSPIKITLTPERRGQHQLNVKINGAHIKDSPFTVIVYMPPNLLSRPVAIISEMKRPGSLVYSQAEDKVLVTLVNEGRLMKVELQSGFVAILIDFISLPFVSEITWDAERNIIYATTDKNELHKVSNDGKIIKTVGRLGKRNAEFNFPIGLRVSKNNELYVCDSRNHRVQVFDLDLNFKRSFGKKGTGRGQFNVPADVDFDSCGNIYITDVENHRIQVFTCTECHIRNINRARIGTFRPISLLVHDEKLYITDSGNHSVWVMSTTGETIATFGDGILRSPEGITMDKDGFVYVTSHYSKIFVF